MTADNSEEVKVLVVGDWVVDEDWLVASHDPRASTHSGKEHFRSLIDDLDSQILNVSGAGRLARILHGLSTTDKNSKTKLSIYGLGLWHPEDTKPLASFFSLDKVLEQQTPLTLQGITPRKGEKLDWHTLCRRSKNKGKSSTESEDINPCQYPDCLQRKNKPGCDRLYTLADLLEDEKALEVGTTRVLRIYKYGPYNELECEYRFDWAQENLEKLNYQKSKPKPKSITHDWRDIEYDAIVVFDLGKRVVTKELIKFLNTKNTDANWYIRSKVENPEWIQQINEKVRLQVIGADIMDKLSSTIKWFFGKTPTLEGIKKLKELGQLDKRTESLVVGIINENHALAIKKNGNSLEGYLFSGENKTRFLNVGRSSIFFGSMIASMLGVS